MLWNLALCQFTEQAITESNSATHSYWLAAPTPAPDPFSEAVQGPGRICGLAPKADYVKPLSGGTGGAQVHQVLRVEPTGAWAPPPAPLTLGAGPLPGGWPDVAGQAAVG